MKFKQCSDEYRTQKYYESSCYFHSSSLPFTSSLSCRWSISVFLYFKMISEMFEVPSNMWAKFLCIICYVNSCYIWQLQHWPCCCVNFFGLLDPTLFSNICPSPCADIDNSEKTEFWVSCLSSMILCFCGRKIWYLCVGNTVRFYSSGWSGISLLFSDVKKYVVELRTILCHIEYRQLHSS